MKNNQDIVKLIDTKILRLNQELAKLITARKTLGDDDDESPNINESLTRGQQLKNRDEKQKPVDIFHSMEDKFLMAWKPKQMEKMIIDSGLKVPKYLSTRIYQAVQANKIICMKFNDSNKYAYYTTRKEWIEKDYYKRGKHRILPAHAPKDERLNKLSEEELNPENITWSGID